MSSSIYSFLQSQGPFEGNFELHPGSVVGIGPSHSEVLCGRVRLRLIAGKAGEIYLSIPHFALASLSGRVQSVATI